MGDEAIPSTTEDSVQPTGIEIASRVLPHTLHVLPLKERPFLPVQTTPLTVPETPWLETFTEAGKSPQRMLGLLLARDAEKEVTRADDLHEIGTAIRIHHAVRQNETIQFVAEGVQRFKVVEWLSREPAMLARVEYLYEPAQQAFHTAAMLRLVRRHREQSDSRSG